MMHMRTTVIIDDELLSKAQQLSGLNEKTAVLHAGLRALIARENARRLASLGGTERNLKPIPRRRARSPEARKAPIGNELRTGHLGTNQDGCISAGGADTLPADG